ncbi:hypothetical protein SAMN05880501_103114 [Ureibacillus xyleni]|uniref:Ribbon-helix-helix CopG family protein n=1 Tax=Ureibacillus xyleni TaxID=614648 RepID=A0A285S629_9BACL|nr:hypothetical protein [Ureibacillus xyleni]SOC02829.1 hypothetical protein SAMN05880501_103114 [Ureibacillus xyleni]
MKNAKNRARITSSIPKSSKEEVRAFAEKHKMSMSKFVELAIREKLSKEMTARKIVTFTKSKNKEEMNYEYTSLNH